MEVAKPLFRQIREVGPDQVATDCPLAALQFAQGTGLEPRHPIQVLAAAGFRSTEPVTRDREVSVEKIRLGDVKNLSEYEKVRDAVRRAVIASQGRRRVPVGEHLSFVFENRGTVLLQIQEMIRAERIVAEGRCRTRSTSTTPSSPTLASSRPR